MLTSREALESSAVPERLVVIGAGAVGLEFAYVYAMYGAQVTVVEMADQMIPGADPEVARRCSQREFRRKGIEVRTGHALRGAQASSGDGCRGWPSRARRAARSSRADQVLVAIGRRPLSADLGLEAAGVELDARGFVRVDAQLAHAAAPSVRAIGDLVGGAAAGPQGVARRASPPSSSLAGRVAAARSTTTRSRPASTPSRRWPGSASARPRRASATATT